MTTKSDTPRTDEIMARPIGMYGYIKDRTQYEVQKLCRDLERELNQVKQQYAQRGLYLQDCEAQLHDMRKERDRYREALERADLFMGNFSFRDAWQVIQEALHPQPEQGK